MIGHLADGERVFSYRLTRIARGDETPLAGFDENAWAKSAPHRKRPMTDVVNELLAIRRSTLALVDSLDESSISNKGVANNNPVTARAICWIIAGHTRHHLDILRERYACRACRPRRSRCAAPAGAAGRETLLTLCAAWPCPAAPAQLLSRTDSTFARE